jgi:hypothetical protein
LEKASYREEFTPKTTHSNGHSRTGELVSGVSPRDFTKSGSGRESMGILLAKKWNGQVFTETRRSGAELFTPVVS